MVVTCVAFTRSLPAPVRLRELPIEAAATAHLDRRYVADSRVRTGRLPGLEVDFRGRPITVAARALHHLRVDLVDVVLEVTDAEAAAYLAAFDDTAAAVTAELFRRHGDGRSIATLHGEVADDLLGGQPRPGHATGFHRLVFHRDPDTSGDHEPLTVWGHRLALTTDRVDVAADTTVLPDERLGYEMVVGLCARSRILVDELTRTIDRLALAAGDPGADPGAVLEEATETQRRAIVVQREVTAHRLLAAELGPIAARVDEVVGVGLEGRREFERALGSLGQLTGSVFTRAIARRIDTWERYAAVALVLAAIVALTLVALALR